MAFGLGPTFREPDFSGAIGEEWTSTDFLGNVTRMAPGIELKTSSGMLSVTIDPRPHWLVGLATLTVDLIFVGILYHFWSAIPVWVRVFWIFVLVPGLWRSLYEFFGEEIIEFNSQTLTVRKGIHGWERKHEYPVNECSELEWQPGNNGHSYLSCKVGRWPKTFGNGLSENEGIEILAALQQTLPDVAQKICSYPSIGNIS